MENKLKKLIDLVKRLPEETLDEAMQRLEEIKKQSDELSEQEIPPCPHCKSEKTVKYGSSNGRQRYLCRACKKTFGQNCKSAMFGSHSGPAVWKQVIADTINGVAIDQTAAELDLHHETVFNMRHKILFSIEQNRLKEPNPLQGLCEADETYLLESIKGTKIPEDYHREARKHGAVAKKRGISSEYICVCAAVERDGKAFSVSVNRANPTSEEILQAFEGNVNRQTVFLCDGNKSYDILDTSHKCDVHTFRPESDYLNNINTVNGFHSFIKERNRKARGFATKYLNRYNSLFSSAYRSSEYIVEDIYKMMSERKHEITTIADTQSRNLLNV